MALTRKMLKAMGIDAEVIDQIIEAHTESLEAIKAERDAAQANADKLAEVQAQLEKANNKVAELEKNGGEATKVQAAFDAYKQQVEAEKTNATKAKALDALLKDSGITRDSFRAAVAKNFDLNTLELDESGAIKTAADIKTAVEKDYADFKATTSTEGTPNAKPITGGGAVMTKDQIMAIKDTSERHAAIAANRELFGI